MTSSLGSTVPEAAVIDGVNVDAVAAAVLGCAGVAGLDGGRFGEVTSYLPGRRVRGVVVSGGRVTVQIRSRWAVPAPGLAALITAVLAPLTGRRPVDVVIADIDDPPGPPVHKTPVGRPDLAAGPLT
jgi:ABC-type xylose transport system permease subunit